MKRRTVIWILIFLGAAGSISLFFHQTSQKQAPNLLESSIGDRNILRQQPSAIGSSTFQHNGGRQYVDDLLAKYSGLTDNPLADEKYPQRDWLEMLLNQGIVIENYDDYSGYMAARAALVKLENQPEMWKSDVFGLPPTDDWETFEAAFIERKIWEYEVFRNAIQSDPEVNSGVFTGPNKQKFLPMKPGRVYVKRKENGAVFIGSKLDDDQQNALFYDGIQPDGYEISFIDDNGERLPEILPPILSDSVLETENIQLQEDIPTQIWDIQAEHVEENNGQMPQNEVEAHELTSDIDEDFDAFLESLSVDEFKALEKFMMEEFSEPVQTPQALDPQIETELRKQFSHTDITQALEKLNRFGVEEGTRKLFDENPELATYLQKHLMPKNEDSK